MVDQKYENWSNRHFGVMGVGCMLLYQQDIEFLVAVAF